MIKEKGLRAGNEVGRGEGWGTGFPYGKQEVRFRQPLSEGMYAGSLRTQASLEVLLLIFRRFFLQIFEIFHFEHFRESTFGIFFSEKSRCDMCSQTVHNTAK